ncbi:MAG: pentapeptide repeat-containing protein [Acidimicrobiales bacterium]
MRILTLVVALAVGGVTLDACANASTTAYAPSARCSVSTTNTDYAGCNLSGRDLQGVDFQSDNLRRTDLARANLDGANLEGATTKGAITKGTVTNRSTVCVNAVPGPCTSNGLRGTGSAETGN